MTSTTHRRTLGSALTLIALAAVGLAFAVASNATASDPGAGDRHRTTERLVVRGEATVTDVQCDGGLCLELAGSFRGTPVGTGAYAGAFKLKIADAFPNGEGGGCAPMRGDITLGAGSPDRLVLAVTGDSCQDGAGNPENSSFTGLARFSVRYGTGAYAHARGNGLATFAEDVADQDRMTLVGHITR